VERLIVNRVLPVHSGHHRAEREVRRTGCTAERSDDENEREYYEEVREKARMLGHPSPWARLERVA
jgi:hypothetical protein